MAKYYGLDYQRKLVGSGVIDRLSVNKHFADDHPERDALLAQIVERLNLLIAKTGELASIEAHDISYIDANGVRRNVGDMLDSLALAEVNVIMLVDSNDNQLTDTDDNQLVA